MTGARPGGDVNDADGAVGCGAGVGAAASETVPSPGAAPVQGTAQAQETASGAEPTVGLANRAARGAAVTLAGQIVRMVLQLAAVVVLARLLAPRDYGLLAMVLVVVGIGEIFRDFGLTNAVLRAPVITAAEQRGLFWVSTAIGLGLSVLVFASAPLVAMIFGQPALVAMTRVLSLTFVVNGLATQYRADLTRRLRYVQLAISDVAGQAAGLCVAIGLAADGAGRWALVAQQLVGLTTVLVLVAVFAGWWPGLPRRGSGVGHFVRLGSNLAATTFIYYIGNNLDTITIGLRFPSSSLGLYNRGFQLLMTPLNQLRVPATDVALPVFARLGDDYARAAEFLKRGQLAFGYTIVPVMAAVVGAAGPIVAVLLGPRWSGVTPILALLAVAAACQTLAYVGFWVYVSRGLAAQLFRYTLLTLVLQLVCIVAGSIWGVVGVAAGYATAAVLEWPLSLMWLSRLTPLPVRSLMAAAGRILLCAAPAGAVAALGAAALRSTSDVLAALVAVLSVALTYAVAGLVSVTVRSDLRAVGDFTHRMIRRS